MAIIRRRAGNERVQAFDFVSKAIRDQEIQRAIGDRRVRRVPGIGQPRKHVIGAEGSMFFQQDIQHATAYFGQAKTTAAAGCLDHVGGLALALGMIVAAKCQWFSVGVCFGHLSKPG